MTTSTAAIVDEQLTAPVVGVDVGGTKIAAALVSADGGLLGPVAEAPTPAREVISAHSADLNRGMHGRTLSYFADEVYERFDDDVLRRKGKCRQ